MASALLGIILFFSGAFSLIYQIAWIRGLTLLLGTSTLAITTVTCSFMGGLALGSIYATNHLIKNNKSALSTYTVLEGLISVSALLSPLALFIASKYLPSILAMFDNSANTVAALRLMLSLLVLIIPTTCMGATLPVVSKTLENLSANVESKIGTLYGLNTIGACLGCLTAGFYLLPKFGLTNTILIASTLNFLLPIILILNRKGILKTLNSLNTNSSTSSKITKNSRQSILFWSAGVVGFTGLASELIWTRVLVLTVGGSIYTFSVLLSCFLFFYGLGAIVAGRIVKIRKLDSSSAMCTSLILVGLFTATSINAINSLPDLFISNFSSHDASSPLGMLKLQILPTIALMALPAITLGLFFPIAIREYKRLNSSAAENTGRIYAWNTFGAILGTISTTFVLIPIFGLDSSLRITATLPLLAAFALAIQCTNRVRIFLASAIIFTSLFIYIGIAPVDKELISAGSGAYSKYYREQADSGQTVKNSVTRSQELLFYQDGFSATITVSRDRESQNNDLYLSTNGKIDGSSHFDMPTQKLAAHFTSIFHSKPQTAFVLGFGTGTTVGSFSLYPNLEVDVAEIEPSIVQASSLFRNYNNRPLSKSNVNLHYTDGRLLLQLRPNHYDLIFSEPSNPWIAGVSDLFTLEFYEIAKSSLRERGVFSQWLQIYDLDIQSIKLVMRTFQRAFPNTYVAITLPGSDLLLIGTTGNYVPSKEDIMRKFSRQAIKRDMADENVNIVSAEHAIARFIFGPKQTIEFVGEGEINSDELPILSYRAPLSLNKSTKVENMRKLKRFDTETAKVFSWNLSDEEVKLYDSLRRKDYEKYFNPINK